MHNIGEWVKHHPGMTAGIVGGVIVLYLLYSSSGSSSGSGSGIGAYYAAEAQQAQASEATTIAEDQLKAQTNSVNAAVTENASNNVVANQQSYLNYQAEAQDINAKYTALEQAQYDTAATQQQQINAIASNPNILPSNYSSYLGYQLGALQENAVAQNPNLNPDLLSLSLAAATNNNIINSGAASTTPPWLSGEIFIPRSAETLPIYHV